MVSTDGQSRLVPRVATPPGSLDWGWGRHLSTGLGLWALPQQAQQRAAPRSTGVLCFLMNASLFFDLNDQLLVWRQPGLKWLAKKKWSVTRSRGASSDRCCYSRGNVG